MISQFCVLRVMKLPANPDGDRSECFNFIVFLILTLTLTFSIIALFSFSDFNCCCTFHY